VGAALLRARARDVPVRSYLRRRAVTAAAAPAGQRAA
jgi:hypothetical protein